LHAGDLDGVDIDDVDMTDTVIEITEAAGNRQGDAAR
jgi:hypothetical protein